MNRLIFGCALCVAAMLPVGCGGGVGSSPSGPGEGAGLPAIARHARGAMHLDRGKSWISSEAKLARALLYVADWSTNDVFVYDYTSGKPMGKLTGDDEPYGMCVDATGNIYITNFGAGDVVEYARGGTTLLHTYDSGGEPLGCAVDAKGDVAVTDFGGTGITVYANGNPSKGKTYSDPDCQYDYAYGYDNRGNLVGGGEGNSGAQYCALLAGQKKMTTLAVVSNSFSIDFPGGVTWDGKYFALGDQEAGGTYQTGVVQATLGGTTLTFVSETTFSDDCYGDYTDDVNPFIVGKKNTPVNDKQGNTMVGPNLWCVDGGAGKVDYWPYPAGGDPYKNLASPPAEPYGAAVSLAR